MLGVVLFSPGSGGNHLRNLLDSHWDNDIRLYLEDSKDVDLDEESHKEDSRFVISHMNTYVRDINEKSRMMLDRKVFLITVPNWDSLARSRMAKLYSQYADPTFYNDMSTLYTMQFLASLDPKPDVFCLDSGLLWNKDIGPMMDWIELNSPIILDRDHCRFIHAKWCGKVGL